mgnify:CR=1 FL=1
MTPDKRRVVAEACTGHKYYFGARYADGTYSLTNKGRDAPWNMWEPEKDFEHKDALIRKCAELMIPRNSFCDAPDVEGFLEALATSNVDGIEGLCYELIKGEIT